VVDVSAVRGILSQIRRVVSGDIILPEDHNLQTDAITKLTDVVETIPPPGAPAGVPIILPAVTPPFFVQGGYDYEFAPFVYRDIIEVDGVLVPGFPMPFQVTLKKFLVHIRDNLLDATATITVFHDETNIITTISIPAGATGVFTTTINDYIVPENGRIAFYVDLRASSPYIDTRSRLLKILYMYLVGVIG
jgi:hypothetical protein